MDVILFTCLTVITGVHLSSARGLLRWSQHDLANEAGVNVGTIRRMEGAANGPVVANTVTLDKVMRALERKGVEFLNDGSPGVRIRTSSKSR